jgi:DNA-binding NtrC family response regulator
MAFVKVLIVDDDLRFVETMSRRLARSELSVEQALSGSQALEKLQKDRDIDVVILDMDLPGTDGVLTLSEVKKSHPLVEVIALTDLAAVDSAIEALKFGAYDYMTRPCNMDELIVKIAEAAARKAHHEEKILQATVQAISLSVPE